MEKEEYKLEEQAEVEEQEAEETTPLVRNSRNGDDSKIIPNYGVEINGGVSNGVSQNENEELIIPAENQKMEEIDWVLENEAINEGEESEKKVLGNGAEAINEGKNSKENLVFHEKAEGVWKCRICTWKYGNGSVCVDGLSVNPIPTYIHKTLIVEDPAHTKHDVSSLVPVIQFNGASVINNQHGEEGKEDGFSSSDGLPSDSSSQEGLVAGVDSTYAYIIREPFLKGPAKFDVSSLDPVIQLNGASVINIQHEEEDKENGVLSSDALSSDSSSQEDLVAGVDSTSTYIIREPVLKGPAKYTVSSLDPVIPFNGASVINNQHEEEDKENGVSSSDALSSDNSSQEDLVEGTIREPILKGPAKYDVSSLDPVIQFNGASVINNQHEDENKENGVSSSDVMSSDSSSQEYLVESVNSTPTYTIREPILKGPGKYIVPSLDPAVEFNGASEISNQYEEEIEKNSISETIDGPSKEIESEETELINEDDLEITELDVERVIRKQTTHDLYCPNCKSCITKRVILSKRKRRRKIPDEEVKCPKTETAAVGTVSSEDQVHQEGEVGNDDAQTQPIDEDDRERVPAIFRCLSCFSIFIPTGDGFRLFGGRSEKENARDAQAPVVKKSWFDIFKPNRQKTLVGEGISSETNMQQVSSAIPSSSPARPARLEGTTADEIQDLKLPLLVDESNAVFPADQQMESKPSREVQTIQGNDVVQLPQPSVSTAVDADGTLISVSIPHNEQEVRATIMTTSILDSINVDSRSSDIGNSSETNVQQVSLAIPSPSPARVSGQPLVLQDTAPPARAPARLKGTTAETAAHEDLKIPLLDKSDAVLAADQQTEPKPIQEVQTIQDNDIVQLPQPSVDADSTLISVSIPHNEQDVRATIVTTSVLDNRNVDSSIDTGEVYPAEVPQKVTTTTTVDFRHDKPLRTSIISEIGDAPSPQGVGNDTRITIIDTHPVAIITPSTVSQSGTQTSTAEREGLGAREERKVEVIKSIVYGGLAETMTSLSVVSSAAGGGAATLNVLTLGAANLIGGLFIIAHNLWDLKCDRVEEQLSNQVTEQADRYRQLLGRRQNFALHAFVAIVAYITFGLVPPVVYGFSFRESDDKQLKLLMVAAASFVCILVLTLGKAYVQRPPKPYLKTVMTFLIIGISASGVSYAAGGLVERLLEKLGLFEPSSVAPNLLVPEMRPVGSGWASY